VHILCSWYYSQFDENFSDAQGRLVIMMMMQWTWYVLHKKTGFESKYSFDGIVNQGQN